MKKFLLLFAAVSVAAIGWYQVSTPARPLAELMPGGALMVVEAKEFGAILREWNKSSIKTEWTASGNFEVFSRSNLYSKLTGVYQQYAAAAGFEPDLDSLQEIAGAESSLAFYELREVEFLYITHLGERQLLASKLWALRDKFEQRQAAVERRPEKAGAGAQPAREIQEEAGRAKGPQGRDAAAGGRARQDRKSFSRVLCRMRCGADAGHEHRSRSATGV